MTPTRLARALVLVLIGAALAPRLPAQGRYPTHWSPATANRPDVKAALETIERGFPAQVEEWIRITQMEAKSGHEQARGAYVKQAMEAEGLTVTVDSIGNVTGRRPGTGGGPTVVFAAHLDTVHPLGTDVRVTKVGDTLRAPGVFDNSASVANMLAVVRALNAAKVKTKGDLVFVGTTQEEVGLRGMDYWLEHNPRPDMLVAMDGGLGPIDYGALGIYWTKYVFTSAGSHTVTSRGKPTPVRALADAIQRISALRFPSLQDDGAVANVGQVHGGAIFNGIPQELYFTMDLRSTDPALIDSLDREIDRAVQSAAERERVGWKKEIVQRNRAGGTPKMLEGARAHPIVQTTIDVFRFAGADPGPPGKDAEPTGSTDANMGVVRGIPSVSIGRSRGGNQHTLTEWAHWPSALPATRAVLLLAVSLGDGGAGASRAVQ